MEVKNIIHEKFLLIQRLYRFINGPKFHYIYEIANNDEKEELLILVQEIDHNGLVKWCENIIRKRLDFQAFNMRDLRMLARKLGIKNYSYLTRSTLLSEIKSRKLEHEKRNIRSALQNEIIDVVVWCEGVAI